jgi:hypothetical protein
LLKLAKRTSDESLTSPTQSKWQKRASLRLSRTANQVRKRSPETLRAIPAQDDAKAFGVACSPLTANNEGQVRKLIPHTLLLIGAVLLFLFWMVEAHQVALPFFRSLIVFFGGITLVLLALATYSIGFYARMRSKRRRRED